MRRCLILANQTLVGDRLARSVQERMAAEEHEFYVVVPATPIHEHVAGGGLPAGPSPQEAGFALAQQRLDLALEQIHTLGAAAAGEVGDADPLQAARLALGRFPADEVVVQTMPLGLSKWLRGNLPAKVARAFALPVTHVTAEAFPEQ